MTEESFFFKFSITGEELSKLFLLLGTTSLESVDNETFSLNGAKNHTKLGIPGLEDGANHYFDTLVGYMDIYGEGKVSLNSRDGGKTYWGGVKFAMDARTDIESIKDDVKKYLGGQNPATWVATQERLVGSALKAEDKQLLARHEKEIAMAIGEARARWWVLEIKEKMESEKK